MPTSCFFRSARCTDACSSDPHKSRDRVEAIFTVRGSSPNSSCGFGATSIAPVSQRVRASSEIEIGIIRQSRQHDGDVISGPGVSDRCTWPKPGIAAFLSTSNPGKTTMVFRRGVTHALSRARRVAADQVHRPACRNRHARRGSVTTEGSSRFFLRRPRPGRRRSRVGSEAPRSGSVCCVPSAPERSLRAGWVATTSPTGLHDRTPCRCPGPVRHRRPDQRTLRRGRAARQRPANQQQHSSPRSQQAPPPEPPPHGNADPIDPPSQLCGERKPRRLSGRRASTLIARAWHRRCPPRFRFPAEARAVCGHGSPSPFTGRQGTSGHPWSLTSYGERALARVGP
ncbi:hypothetical protein SAMN05216360_1042 [Methylobacterium phyllostachyos]|uniref:Uncharacterized protein n=1 Tax=Methylobacterium phyllostachyos TaxID=582672 RepID=A0A1G9WIB6_9HYPH|nr:hypothetical protein SAMN05216360_1042 [Methylobacterium phyllostachyos]